MTNAINLFQERYQDRLGGECLIPRVIPAFEREDDVHCERMAIIPRKNNSPLCKYVYEEDRQSDRQQGGVRNTLHHAEKIERAYEES